MEGTEQAGAGQRAEALVRHLVDSIVSHPNDVSVQVVEGESVVVLELVVHPDDRAVVEGDRGRTLRALRNLLSAASGSSKATLDLVAEHGAASEE
jgi:predicted RNA-binding protein YlqC (UPF0109 family)